MDAVRRFAVALFVALALIRPIPSSSAEPYDIDVIVSSTGVLALVGIGETAALHVLEETVNKSGGIHGRPVHFVIVDDQSQPAQTVQLANAIIAKHVPVILGPSYTSSCLALGPLIRANGPLTYCFSPSLRPAAGGYLFSGSISSLDQARAMINFVVSKHWQKIAIVASTDATGAEGEGQIDAAIAGAKLPVTVVDREHFAPADVTISAQATRVKAAAPDVIFVTSVGTPTVTALHGLSDAGLANIPVIQNFGNLIHAQLRQAANFLPTQAYFTAPRFVTRDVSRPGPVRDEQLRFYAAMKAHGIDPDVPHNLPWDPALIVIDALRHLAPNPSGKDVLDYIEQSHGFAGTNGIYDFRDGSQRGVGLNGVVIVRWNAATSSWSTASGAGGTKMQ